MFIDVGIVRVIFLYVLKMNKFYLGSWMVKSSFIFYF